ncbi:flavodoxin FldB [Pontibacter sp. JAM-7]|uniref:flavodoxin FldB n=1 Tax=Pontibacter sp. JAM-7 TaxID=3366581 RepID=UPI003AF686BF
MTHAIALLYGSTTGNTESVAELIAEKIGFNRVHRLNIATDGIEAIAEYDYLIMGIPTWDFGQIQEDWEDLWSELETTNFSGKHCALFGLGDQIGYGEWFLDAMGKLHDCIQAKGGQLVGYWPIEGYDFEASKALTADGKQFVGLALDEDSQNYLTEERVTLWSEQVVAEFGLPAA